MQSSSVCLVVVYNHNFERNIPIIKRIYADRFSMVVQIMPFYRGTDPSVIGVYDCSYQYSGYIAQASSRLISLTMLRKPSHYVFVADDMVINPRLNEENIVTYLKIAPGEAFHPRYWILSTDLFLKWYWGPSSIVNVCCASNACEWRAALPSIDIARNIFESKGLDWRKMVSLADVVRMYKKLTVRFTNPYCIVFTEPYDQLKKLVKDDPEEEKMYPLVGGFSDFFAVPSQAMSDFCHYCGVFAAMRAFVETAIPTSLVLSCHQVKTLDTCKLKAENGVANNDIRDALFLRYQGNYKELVAGFAADMLYIHPVKLSKWNNVE